MGGSIDPKTGQIVWDMHVPLAEQLVFYRSHPPRAIGALKATPIDVEWDFDGHGEPVNAIFELTCPCGGKRFVVVVGITSDGEAIPPISIECGDCDASFEIFDAAKHGYDAELNRDEVEVPEADDELVSAEVEAPHEVVVRYEYPSEHLGAPEGADDPEIQSRVQDLFSWFTLLARDPVTKRLAFLFDAECA